MNVPDAVVRAVDDVRTVIEQIKPDQWSAPTPNTEWDVRALTHHLVYELLWVQPLLEGKTIEQVGDAFEGDVLGEEPGRAFAGAGAQVQTAVRVPDAMTGTAHLSFGDLPGEEYARQILFDLVVHGWDLRTAIDADTTLDPELVEAVWDWANEWMPRYRAAGAVADPVPLPDDASKQDRLIALTGRHP